MEAKIIVITVEGPVYVVTGIVNFVSGNDPPSVPLTRPEESNAYGDFKWLLEICSWYAESTLRKKSAAGKIPGLKKIEDNGRVLYHKFTVQKWIDESVPCKRKSKKQLELTADHQINERLDEQSQKQKRPKLG